MHQPDLRRFVYGRYVQRLLVVCGVRLPHSEPPPRVVGSIPPWFRSLCAILTVVGLVAGIRMLDKRFSPRPVEPLQQAEVGGLGPEALDAWAEHLRFLPDSAPAFSVGGRLSRDSTDFVRAYRLPAEDGATQNPQSHRFLKVLVTAYTSAESETDDSPHLTASMEAPAPGTLAMSRDLLRTFTLGAPFDFGDKVLIPGVGIFEVKDAMGPRWTEKADIWCGTSAEARAWGRRTVFVTRVAGSTPILTLQPE